MFKNFINHKLFLKKIKSKKWNALFIDGGGTKGIFGSAIIQKLGEKKYNKFNILAGSSIGGILILCYEFINFNDGHQILIKSLKKMFKGNIFTKIFNFIFFGEFYREKKKKKIFMNIFGDKKIKDLPKEKIFFITAVDFVNGNPIIIENVTGKWDETYLWEVACYTSNAPFYFNDKNSHYIDGGFYANDPRTIYLTLIEEKFIANKINSFLSIGSMLDFKKMTKKDIKQNWFNKIPRIFDMLINIEAQNNDKWFNELNKKTHLRICLDSKGKMIPLDNINDELIKLVDESVKSNSSKLNKFVKENLEKF